MELSFLSRVEAEVKYQNAHGPPQQFDIYHGNSKEMIGLTIEYNDIQLNDWILGAGLVESSGSTLEQGA